MPFEHLTSQKQETSYMAGLTLWGITLIPQGVNHKGQSRTLRKPVFGRGYRGLGEEKGMTEDEMAGWHH